MKILALRDLAGPNIYSRSPVIRVRLDIGEYEYIPSNQINGFVERLLNLLPGLMDHHCSRGHPGGFAARLQEGTYLAHIFEHVIIELQCRAGYEVNFGKARGAGQPGLYDVVTGYGSVQAAMQAVYAAKDLLIAVRDNTAYDVEKALTVIRRAGLQSDLGPSTAAIYQAAMKRDIPVYRYAGQDLLVLGYGSRQQRIWTTITDKTSALALDIACDKYMANKILADNGIPVPYGIVVTDAKAAVEAARAIEGVVAVKPLMGNHGKGVTLNISRPEEIERAFNTAVLYDKQVLVEEFIPGRQYRLCMVNGRLAAGAERIPAYIIGDGKHTIAQLVETVNCDPVRGDHHTKPLSKIIIDAVAITVLGKQGLTPQSVPGDKQIVYVRENANISTGGTAVDVTDIIHPENVYMAERVAQLIGLDVAGIDIVVRDITKPIGLDNDGAVIEINAAPGLRMHHYPAAGKARNVADQIVNYLFPNESNGRIPLISITGTNGKTTVTRMIGHMFQLAGYRVGMTTTDGIFINGQRVLSGDTTGPNSARMVLGDKRVDIAVLETARGGMLRGGLAYDKCDIGIITNITEDHIGQDGVESLEELAYIKSLVIETVRLNGHAIINADDSNVMLLIDRARGEKVYFSIEPSNVIIRRHLGTGGRAVFVKDGVLYAAHGAESIAVASIGDIAVTLGGIALHNLQNAVIATAACYCFGLSYECIRNGLLTFAENPGRLMLLSLGDYQVCVDYGHNPAGYQALIHTMRRLNAKRLVGVIAAPGDRRDDMTVNIGRIAGSGFDFLYIKEDADLRGRKPGEVAELLRRGALAAGIRDENIVVILDEETAVKNALANARKDDLIVIFFEKYDKVMTVIEAYQNTAAEEKREIQHTEAEPAVTAGASIM